MSLKYRLPLVFFFTFFLLFLSVHAHGPSPAHARRSLAFKKKLHRQLDIPGALGDIIGGVGDLLGNTGSSTPGPSSTSTTSSDTTSPPTTDPANTDPPSTSYSTTTTPSSDAPSTTPPPPSPDASTSTPSTTSSGTSSSPLSSSPPSLDDSSCLLGLDLFGNCVLSVSSSSASSQTTDSLSSPPTDPPTGQTTSTSSSPPTPSPDTPTLTPTPTPTPTPDCLLGLVVNGECVLPSSGSSSASSSSPTSEPPPSITLPSITLPSITPDPNSSSSPPTTNPESPAPAPTPSSSPPVDPCGSVGQLLGLCTSNSSPPATTPPLTSTPQTSPSANPPNSSSQSAPSPTSTPYQPVEPCGSLGIDLGLCTSLPSSATTPQPSPQPTDSSSSPPGSSLSNSFSPPALPTGSSVFTITPPESCGPLGLCGSTTTTTSDSGTTGPSSPPGTQTQPSPSGQSDSSLTTSFPSGIPTSWSGTVSSSMSGSGNGTSLSSPPVIAFPSTNDTVPSTTSFSSTPTSGPSSPSFTPPPQGQLSYVTQASLLGTPVPSSSPVTLSDPDAVPPTLAIVSASNLPSTTTPVLLPSNLPARIYPPTQVDPNSLSGFSLVSILFDQFLSWSFVAQNTQSQGQLFLWLPTIIQSALGLPSEQVKTFALQVFLPATYSGPADVDMLQTTFLLYIPSGQVPVLANQIKVISSPFYTSLGEPYKTLASHVNPAYSLTSVQDPNAVPGSGITSSVNSSGNKSRTDAIIGVASALGGLALGVLGVLIYRSVKRSRDLSHRRLSDPNAPNAPYPDRTGRDFDQDSVGGQRRRSFYFAEDSLRGQQAVQQTAVPVAQPQHEASQVEYSYRTSPDGVRERRAPVVTGAISAPILTQSSLNW